MMKLFQFITLPIIFSVFANISSIIDRSRWNIGEIILMKILITVKMGRVLYTQVNYDRQSNNFTFIRFKKWISR